MAEAAIGNDDSEIQNTVNCPICFEYMLDSRTLYPCIHTFCEKCVSRLDRKRKQGKTGVDCPMCRGFVVENEIRKNRLINFLINLVTKEEDVDSDKQCGQCGITKVVSKCLQCNIELCQNCNDRHKNIPSCRDHQLVLLSENNSHIMKNVIEFCPKHLQKQIRMNCVPCNVAICSLCKFQQHDLHKSETIEAALQRYRPLVKAALENIRKKSGTRKHGVNDMKQRRSEIEGDKNNTIEELKAQKKKLIAKINSDFDKLQQEVQDYSAAKIKELSLAIEETEHFVSSDESVVTYAEAIMANTDGGGLLMELQSGLMDRIEQLQHCNIHKVGVVDQLVFKPSEVVLGMDGNSVGNLEKKEDSIPQNISQSSQPNARVVATTARNIDRPATRALDFPINVTRQMIKKGSFHINEIKAVAERMCLFQNYLLIPNQNTLKLYNLQGELQKTVTIKSNIKSIKSVCPLNNDNLVIATAAGLYQVDSAGNVMLQLHFRKFKDVHIAEKHIAAIGESNTVYLWSLQDLSTLFFSFKPIQHRIDNVIMKENRLYFSNVSSIDNKISIYDLQGKLLQSSGLYGFYGPGQLRSPRICAVDSTDNLLVADSNNNRFQLFSTTTGCWSLLPGELNLKNPSDAVFSGDNLYVLTIDAVLMFTYK